MAMKVLVACEYSGVVRDAFMDRGIWAWSCDLLPSEGKYREHHHQGDVRELFYGRVAHSMALEGQEVKWDLMIAHPPCTYLCSSGARWMRKRLPKVEQAIEFVQMLLNAPIPRICIENPVGILTKAIRPPDQIIQPWQFGHGETKATCLWLVGLPPLKPTNIVDGREARIHKMPPSANRSKERSRTYQGIADAMAEQWGKIA